MRNPGIKNQEKKIELIMPTEQGSLKRIWVRGRAGNDSPEICGERMNIHKIRQRVRELASGTLSLTTVSVLLGVTRSSVRKVLSNRPVTPYLRKRLIEGLSDPSRSNINEIWIGRCQKMLAVYNLYREKKTLGKVGAEFGISRERVRQILNRGTELGLFIYQKLNGFDLIDLTEEKIIRDYQKFLTLKGVADSNGMTVSRLKNLITINGMSKDELKRIRIETKKKRCIERYDAFVKTVGFHLFTSEMQKTGAGKLLYTNIIQVWGSIHQFRKELGIQIPPDRKMKRKRN